MSSQPHQFEVKVAGSKKGSKPIKGSIKRQIFASFIKKMKSILLRHNRSNTTKKNGSKATFLKHDHKAKKRDNRPIWPIAAFV